MSAKPHSDDAQHDTVEIAYGDTFRHTITGETQTVADARDGADKVAWCSGGWDYRSELVAAVRDEPSMYEVVQRHDEYEDTPY